MILGRDLLTALVLDLKFPENLIIGGEGPYEGCLAPMSDLSRYRSKSLMYKIVKLEESFINLYVGKCLGYESSISSTHIMRIILDAKYEKAHLNKVMTEQFQHLIPSKQESLLNI